MNRDRIEGYWKQVLGFARQRWGRLTGNYGAVVAGSRQHVLGEIQAGYGVTRQANEKQLAEWQERQHKVDPLHK